MPFGVSSGIANVIIHAKFHVDRLRGFWAAGPPKVPFPILIGTTLTTVLHYRADCEIWSELSRAFIPLPPRAEGQKRFFGPTLNFDRAYLCNEKWYQ